MEIQEALEYVRSLPPSELSKLSQQIESSPLALWSPSPGPQTQAYYSQADELFYGGAAGGGKSALIIGLAITRHQRSLILRRESTQLRGMIDDIAKTLKTRNGLNKQDGQWRVPDNLAALTGISDQLIEFGGVPNPGDEERHQGIPHDLLAFDEVTQLSEYLIDYLTTWNRSTTPGQRTRAVLTSNPPTPSTQYASNKASGGGLWLLKRYAPWLDPEYKDPLSLGPAAPGELRYYVTLDGTEREHPDPLPFLHEPGKDAFGAHKDRELKQEVITPRSRTFIPAKVQDNPYLASTNYEATLQKLPEPLRSAYLYGDFSISLSDRPLQLIPTEWLRASHARWEAARPPAPSHHHSTFPQTALGVDVSRGGGDKTVLQPRYQRWYGNPIQIPSIQTLNGATVSARVIEHRRDDSTIVIDANGVGASAYDHLRNHTSLQDQGYLKAYVGSQSSNRRDESGVYGFVNRRSAAYWALRTALDPANPAHQLIDIPPHDELTQELLHLTWGEQSGKIKVMPKEDLIKVLGRSPDYADALVMAHEVYDETSSPEQTRQQHYEERMADAHGPNWASVIAHSTGRRPSWSDRALPYPPRSY